MTAPDLNSKRPAGHEIEFGTARGPGGGDVATDTPPRYSEIAHLVGFPLFPTSYWPRVRVLRGLARGWFSFRAKASPGSRVHQRASVQGASRQSTVFGAAANRRPRCSARWTVSFQALAHITAAACLPAGSWLPPGHPPGPRVLRRVPLAVGTRLFFSQA